MIRKVTSWINKLFKSEKPTASPSKMGGDVCMEGDKAIYSAGVGKGMNCIRGMSTLLLGYSMTLI
jgi:hypothetical protein